MNKGKVLIVNLSKGNLGTGPSHLLGALLITAFSQAAEARRHLPEHERAATSRCTSTSSKTSRPIASHRSSRKRASGVCRSSPPTSKSRSSPKSCNMRSSATPERSSSFASARSTPNASRLSSAYRAHLDFNRDRQPSRLAQAHARRHADAAAPDSDDRLSPAGRPPRKSHRLLAGIPHDAPQAGGSAHRCFLPEDTI